MKFCVERRLSRLLERMIAAGQFFGVFLLLLDDFLTFFLRFVDFVALLRDHLQPRQHVAQFAQPFHVFFDGRAFVQQPFGLFPAAPGVGET